MTHSVAEELACTDARLLEAYLDGELDAAGLIEVEAHLNGAGSDGTPGCEACRERLLLQRAMRQSLKRVVRTASVEAYGPAPASRDALRARALTAMIAGPKRLVSRSRELIAYHISSAPWLRSGERGTSERQATLPAGKYQVCLHVPPLSSSRRPASVCM